MTPSATPDPRFRSWLAAQVPPMPDDLLDRSMNTIAATAQDHGLSVRWPVLRFAPAMASAAVVVVAVIAGALLLTNLPQHVVGPQPSQTTFVTPAPDSRTPSATTPAGSEWTRVAIDPAPGRVVTGLIGSAIHVDPSDVSAAVLAFQHTAGNQASLWVFRADGVPSKDLVQLWWASSAVCGINPQTTTIAGHDAAILGYALADQCQPEYVVALDPQTVLVLIDNGGYQGNGSLGDPVPYRPVTDIAELVDWAAADAAQFLSNAPAATPSSAEVQAAGTLIDRYIGLTVHGDYADAWQMLDPAQQKFFHSLAAYSSERRAFTASSGTTYTVTPNPTSVGPVGDWLIGLPDGVEVQLSQTVLVEVDYPRIAGPANVALYLVDGTRIFNVR